MKINILGVPFDELNMAEAVDKVMDFMAEDKFRMICTPNPEIVMNARKDESFMELLNSADMVTADGVGVVWASKYFGEQLEERVSGYDLAQGVFEKMKDTEYTAYFFGGAEGVAEKAKADHAVAVSGWNSADGGISSGRLFSGECSERGCEGTEEGMEEFFFCGAGV